MQTLKFLGRGSAFNTKEGNASAYIKEGGSLLLIDCGENIFDRIMSENLLDGVNKVDVLITHLNSDHVGSLSSLIYYCYYIKKFKVNVCFPNESICALLRLNGHGDEYRFTKLENAECTDINNNEFTPIMTPHINTMTCYAYFMYINDRYIYYSGDNNEFYIDVNNDEEYLFIELDEIYQDTCSLDYEGNVHLSLKKLCEAVPVEYRNKVYCMHIDKDELIDKAKSEGFNVVEVESN